MKIRKATLKDFEQLKKIKQEFYNWECKHDKRINPNYKGINSRLSKNLKQKNTIFYVAEDKKKLVGYVGAEIKKNPKWVKYPYRGHLFNLYIKKEYRNKGIGKKLSKDVFKWFKKNKVKDLMIMVYSFNKKAYNIYKKLGYRDYITELIK